MRQLTGFRINRSGAVDSYIFEWVNKNDAGAMESYTYKGIEPPRPELLTAADNIALISAKMVNLSLTEKDVMDGGCFYGLKMEYPVDADYYKLQIKASVQIPWGYTFKYETPNWRVWYSNTKGDFNNTIKGAMQKLTQECCKYIDGERAQTKLAFTKQETEDEEE